MLYRTRVPELDYHGLARYLHCSENVCRRFNVNIVIYRPGRRGRAKPRAGPWSRGGWTSSCNRSAVISSGPEASICFSSISDGIHFDTKRTYLLQNLEPSFFGDGDSISPRAGVQHTLPDRRSRGTCVHKYDNIRSRVVVEGIPGRRGGNVGGDGARLDPGLGVDELDGLRGDIDSLSDHS